MANVNGSTIAKPVVFSIRLVPNYLWHMLAVGRIGYNSEYAENWRHTVDPDDLQSLASLKPLLTFGEGSGGELAAFFAMLPAWLPLNTLGELRSYFAALDTTLAQRSLRPIAEAFPDADWNDRMLAEDLLSMTFPDDTSTIRQSAEKLAGVYARNYAAYEQMVWPTAKAAMAERRRELTEHFARRDYINDWEKMLHLRFAGDRYEFVLCFVNKGGPDFNSLGYCGNLCYFDKPFDRTCQFISHEIGTHLLIDQLLGLSKNPHVEWRRLYAAFESLAMHYNRQLLGVGKLAYEIPQFHDEEHLALYAELSRQGLNPEAMLKEAVKRGVGGQEDVG